MKTILNCAIYTRVSTDGQAEVEFNSCEAQESKIRAYISSQEDMEVYKVYSDPGFTGANMDRPALQGMFNDIKHNKINLVIAYKIDRLTRSPKDFYQIIEYFEKYEISFISVTERFDTSTPSGRLLRNIMLTFAQFERELTGERVRDKLLERAQKGFSHGGNVPLGYRKENKRLVIDEQESKAVKYIFETYVSKISLSDIVRGLKKNNLFNKEGNPIDKSRICHVLKNPVYTGLVPFRGKTYKGVHEPLISEELFNLAQTVNPHRTLQIKHNRVCYLGGLIQCAECGSSMTLTHSVKRKQRKKTTYYYYRCTSTYKKGWESCSTKQVSAERMDQFVHNNLERISLDDQYLENLVFKLKHAEGSKNPPFFGVSPLCTGFEPSENHEKITPAGIGQTLKIFVQGLKEKKGIEKNLWAKKFIKTILYSKEQISITLWDLDMCDLHTPAARPESFAGFSGLNSPFSDSKKTPQLPFGAAASVSLSGETGIRTLVGFRPRRFPVFRNRPTMRSLHWRAKIY